MGAARRVTDDSLRTRIETFVIGPPDALLSFTRRLARDNGWSLGHARRVEREYRRFLILAATAHHAVTPSDAVDQAWHLHLAYSRDYWEVLCRDILGRPLHHGPAEGGAEEEARHRWQYIATLDSYRATFEENPPRDIWPPVRRRFKDRYRRIDSRRHWTVPRVVAVPAIICSAVAGCTLLVADSTEAGSTEHRRAMLIATGIALVCAALVSMVVAVLRAIAAQREDGMDGNGQGAA